MHPDNSTDQSSFSDFDKGGPPDYTGPQVAGDMKGPPAPKVKEVSVDGNIYPSYPEMAGYGAKDHPRVEYHHFRRGPGVEKPRIQENKDEHRADETIETLTNDSKATGPVLIRPKPSDVQVFDGRKRLDHNINNVVNSGICQCYKPPLLDPVYVKDEQLVRDAYAGKYRQGTAQWEDHQGYTKYSNGLLVDRRSDQYNPKFRSTDYWLQIPWNEHSHNWNHDRHAITNKFLEFDYQARMDYKNRCMNNYHDPDILQGR